MIQDKKQSNNDQEENKGNSSKEVLCSKHKGKDNGIYNKYVN
jgi:hypothetical protein